MEKSTKIALGAGATSLAFLALALYLKKKKQSEAATVAGAAAGISASVAIWAAVVTKRNEKFARGIECDNEKKYLPPFSENKIWFHIGRNMDKGQKAVLLKDHKKFEFLSREILSDIGTKWIYKPYIGNGNYYKGVLSKNMYEKLGKIDSLPGRNIFWFACAGGTVLIRNEWVSPKLNPNPYSVAKDLIKSGLIHFYTDEDDERICDATKLGPLLKKGDVICFKYWNQNRQSTVDNQWHTATVLSNEPEKKELIYLEFHGIAEGLPRVEVWKTKGYDFGRFDDEKLYGGGSW